MQQELTRPEVLSRFVDSKEEQDTIRSCFAAQVRLLPPPDATPFTLRECVNASMRECFNAVGLFSSLSCLDIVSSLQYVM